MDDIQQMQRVVVTDITSVIGVSLVEALTADQDIEKIYVVIRPNSEKKHKLLTDKRIEYDIFVYFDLSNRIGKHCDMFYHLAWPGISTYAGTFEDMRIKFSNIQEILMSVNFMAELGCRQYIGAGGQSGYEVSELGKWSPESACWPVHEDGIAHLVAGLLAKRLVNSGG